MRLSKEEQDLVDEFDQRVRAMGLVPEVSQTWLTKLWCFLGLHAWGAPRCVLCGKVDHILVGSIVKVGKETGRLP